MAMNLLFPEAMIAVAAAGGGLDIDCSLDYIDADVMEQVAAAAAGSGKRPQIIFRNLTMLIPHVAERIAKAGDGCVIFVVY